MLTNEPKLAIVAVHTEENEPPKVWRQKNAKNFIISFVSLGNISRNYGETSPPTLLGKKAGSSPLMSISSRRPEIRRLVLKNHIEPHNFNSLNLISNTP